MFRVAAVLENGQNDRQADRSLGRRHHHHEEREQVPVHLLPLVGEGDKGQVDGIQNQLDRHEHGDDVAAENEAGHAEREQHRAQHQKPGKRDVPRHSSSFRASTMAPTIAIRIRIEVISNGNR